MRQLTFEPVKAGLVQLTSGREFHACRRLE